MEARLIFATPGGIAMNVLNWDKGLAITETDLFDVGTALVSWWNTEIQPMTSSDICLQEVIMTDISTETGGQVIITADLPSCGAISSDAIPMNATPVISWRTASRGRSYRGRTYHLGISTSAVSNSRLVAGVADDLRDAYALLLDGTYVDPVFSLSIVSRCQDQNWLTTAVVTPVTGVLVDDILDSQRRRLPGRGI